MNDRQNEIRNKGFDLYQTKDTSNPNTDFGSIKVGVKKLDDATLNLGNYKNKNM